MKTIANIIIINSQNVKSEHLLAIIITSIFKHESSVSTWMSSTEVANTGLLKLPLDDLKSIRHRLAKLHVIQVIALNISVCSLVDLQLYLTRMNAATIYSYSYKGMLSKSIQLAVVHDITEQQPMLQLYVKLRSYRVCAVYMHINDGT